MVNFTNEIPDLLLGALKSAKITEDPTALVGVLVNSVLVCGIPIIDATNLFPLNSKLEDSLHFSEDVISLELRHELLESLEVISSSSDRSFFTENITYKDSEFLVYFETNCGELAQGVTQWVILSCSYKNALGNAVMVSLIFSKYSAQSEIVALKFKYSPDSNSEIHKGVESLILKILG